MTQRDPVEALLAEFRELARRMELQMPRLPALLSFKEAARELGLKPTQFKAHYVATNRIDVYREPGMHPRVPSSEIARILSEMKSAAIRQSAESRPTQVERKPRTRRPTRSHGARDEVAKFKESLKKMRH